LTPRALSGVNTSSADRSQPPEQSSVSVKKISPGSTKNYGWDVNTFSDKKLTNKF